MGRECIRKLVSVMILILLQVQANEVEEFLGPMEKCLRSIVQECRRKGRGRAGSGENLEYERCMMDAFAHCLSHVKQDEDPIVYRNIKKCGGWCTKTHEKEQSRLVSCLLRCYKLHVRNPYIKRSGKDFLTFLSLSP